MNFKSILLWAGGVAVIALAFQKYGWPGVVAVSGAIVMWMLLHFTRMLTVLKRAANRPVGYVDSAVMLNAKLKKNVNLLHVMALTRSIGLLQTEKDAQPELYRWTDNSQSHVTCSFVNGKLQSWELVRPPVANEMPAAASPETTPSAQ
jgi:hypothetical protein